MYQKYTGIVLKKYPLGEADELLTIFTKERGKIRVKSKATRKIRSRLSGHLQGLNEIEFEATRSRRSNQGGLPVLISARLISLNKYLREDLSKFAWANVGVETLYRLSIDEQENEEVYGELSQFLEALGKTRNENFLVREFQLKLLKLHGYENSKLEADMEDEIEEFLQYVLEREVKSTNFAKIV